MLQRAIPTDGRVNHSRRLHKLAVIVLISASSALASTLTGPVPVITANCTLAGAPVTCSYVADNGFTKAIAQNTFSFGGLGTSTGLAISMSTFVNTAGQGAAFAGVNLDFLAITNGPVRQGLVTYSVSADAEDAGDAASIEGVGAWPSCKTVGCHQKGMLVPFTLGQAFEISVTTQAVGGPLIHSGGGAEMQINMQLFELDGTPVTISAAPEPSTWLLAALGLTLLGTFRAKRYR